MEIKRCKLLLVIKAGHSGLRPQIYRISECGTYGMEAGKGKQFLVNVRLLLEPDHTHLFKVIIRDKATHFQEDIKNYLALLIEVEVGRISICPEKYQKLQGESHMGTKR